jgi:hypothetical protein
MFEVRLYSSVAGRSQATEFLDSLPNRGRALDRGGHHGAARSRAAGANLDEAIKGRPNRGLFEIRTGGFRTLFCQRAGVIWILHVCKKQDQVAGIEAARARMGRL